MATRRILWAAGCSLSIGLAFVAIAQGLSPSLPLRALEVLALFAAGALVLGWPVLWLALRMAGWREPEPRFERRVQLSERLASGGGAAGYEYEFAERDPYDDDEFDELVREALDDLPDWARRALERNVAVIVSDGGRRRGAYGLYHGGGVARDSVADRIVIYRDTLRRDFGDDPQALRAQVVRTVRHELAHHLGFDELGVGELGL
ncbi:MAG: metallopeptidase family protein [Solirubrobacteraceae bacterium]|jgi:predicted Zn-dependent protease with MMP-like domain